MRYLPVLLLLALVLVTAGCTTTKQEVITPPPTTTVIPTPTPEPTVTRPLPGVDPIIGSWDNGMVFNPDGTVGSDGSITWKANEMVQYSYFITTETRAVFDAAGGKRSDPSAISKEWIYNPNSDTIHIRDSSQAVHRILSVTAAATSATAGT